MHNPTSKIILITGCSSGFGLLTAARLASLNHKVIATMRDLNKKDLLLSEIAQRGGSIDLQPLDDCNKESIQSVINYIIKKYGQVDVLINNAGYGIGGFFEDLTDEEIRDQFDVNFFGVQNVTRAVLPLMRLKREGRIINISSVAGFSASPCFGAYSASKWALEAFSESLHHELKLFGIKVLLIEPGTYKTRIFHDNARYAKNFDNSQSPYYSYSQHLKKRVLDYVNNECRKNPEDVAKLVEKLINSKNPAFRNIPDWEGKIHSFLRRHLPFQIYSRSIERILFQNLE